MRVLVCVDPTPASDGSCATTAWLEQPGVLPPLSAEQGAVISSGFVLVACTAWCWQFIRRFLSPKTG